MSSDNGVMAEQLKGLVAGLLGLSITALAMWIIGLGGE